MLPTNSLLLHKLLPPTLFHRTILSTFQTYDFHLQERLNITATNNPKELVKESRVSAEWISTAEKYLTVEQNVFARGQR